MLGTRGVIRLAAAVAVLATLGGTAAAVPAGRTAGPAIAWHPCAGTPAGDRVRCATMPVPLDWAHPGAGSTSVAVAVAPARHPGARIGALMFNPGGPGEGEVGYLSAPQVRDGYFPAPLQDRFDLVAVEPRGTGTNPPLHCPLPVDPAVTRFPRDAAGVARLVRSNAGFGRRCLADTGPLAAHLDTATVARDMDRVRAVLGEPRVSLLGLSYGSMLAQSYAELFPGRVRALVLDAVVDRARPWQQLAVDDAAAVQDGVARFAAWCTRTAGCPLSDVHRTLDALQQRADRGAVRDGTRAVRAEEIAAAVNVGLNEPAAYPDLAAALHRTAVTGTLGALAGYTPAHNVEYPLYRAIICQDVPVPDPAALPAAAALARLAGPTLRGYSEFWDIAAGCAGWPVRSRWTPHPWRVPATFPPALLLAGAHDVATPPRWAESVRAALPGATVYRWNGDGHGAWPTHSPAAVAAAVRYLTR